MSARWCAGRDSPSAAASPCILTGLAWSARLLQLKTVYHTVFYTLQPSRVLVPFDYKQKKQHRKSVLLFMVRWKGLEPLTP